MARRHGCWLVELEGYPALSTDDLTLDELEVAERASGIAYSQMNPLVSIRAAKALLVLVLIRGGAPEDEALTKAATIRAGELHGAFTYVHPSLPPRPRSQEDGGPPSSAPTSVTG